jgi:hypothetical protein
MSLTDNSLGEHYEQLRAQARGELPYLSTPRGLALFLRQGMPGWILAWSYCTPATRTTAPRAQDDRGSVLRMSYAREVAVLLANMALKAQKERQLC